MWFSQPIIKEKIFKLIYSNIDGSGNIFIRQIVGCASVKIPVKNAYFFYIGNMLDIWIN